MIAEEPVTYQTVPVPAPVDLTAYGNVPLTLHAWRLGSVILALLAFFAGTGVLVGAALLGVTTDLDGSALVAALLGLYVVPYAGVVVVAVTVVRRSGMSAADAIGLRAFRPGAVGLALGAALAGRVLVGQVVAVQQLIGLNPPANLDVTQLFPVDVAGVVSLTTLTVAVAPVVEEVLFRGMMLPALRRRWGTTAAVAVSSLAFGLIHFDPFLFVPMSLVGVLLSVTYLSTRSLWIPIATHALFNLTGVGMLYLARYLGLV